MELKTYQKRVIADLSRYLELLNETKNLSGAYSQFWQEKGISAPQPYVNALPGVPSVCAKVPTGGGKTFLACNAILPIFDALPAAKVKAVVWLVPSDAILVQTLAALRDPSHPYRHKLDVDFGQRVTVYTKEQLLNGQQFNPAIVAEQLSVMVLSYDSFRGRRESLKARQENSSLAGFAKALGRPENPVEGADETALLQVINQLSPLVVVDESHHAKSALSLEMLRDFNPCFVLELTATPRKQSNIISYVDAAQLKKENMVKLPVVVFNRDSQSQVLTDAITLRDSLEEKAAEQRAETGRYIRPIVLFQAQPKNKESSTTFEKLREQLVEIGIPAGQIAIRTADVNELKNVDLMSEDCPVRYIITVNALKEGWDCPFAYILASLANKTSQIDVEQILGRVLRLPHTAKNPAPELNMSYVLTSSSDFKATLDSIVRGLNSAGFSARDCRSAVEITPPPEPETSPVIPRPMPEPQAGDQPPEEEPFFSFDPQTVGDELKRRREDKASSGMLTAAYQQNQEYEQQISQSDDDPFWAAIPTEEREKVASFPMNAEFAEEAAALHIPQFFYAVPENIFTKGTFVPLSKELLSEGFTLRGKPTDIDFESVDTEIFLVDVQDDNTPKMLKMGNADQEYIKKHLSRLPPKGRVESCRKIISHQLNRMNEVDSRELERYVEIVVGNLTPEQLSAFEKSPLAYARKIQEKIETLLEEHATRQFDLWLETGRIVCRESFRLPPSIHPARSTGAIGKSLYAAEEDMDGLELDVVMELTALPNVKWWHRNIARREFAINGFLNHYPDIMIMTERGHVVFAEVKGEHLKNDDSRQKVRLGRAWQNAAGSRYRYYMVFRDTDTWVDGAVSVSEFLRILENL